VFSNKTSTNPPHARDVLAYQFLPDRSGGLQ